MIQLIGPHLVYLQQWNEKMEEAENKIRWRATVKKEIEDAYGSGWRSWMEKGGFMEQLAKKLNESCTLKPCSHISPMGLVLGDDVHDFFSPGPDWTAIDAFIVMVTMHSYLQDLWIHGWSDSDEGWRQDRNLTWDRWVLSMELLFPMTGDEAIKLASEFFEASDSIHAYT